MNRPIAKPMTKIVRKIYKRLGILHVGRRRARDLFDFIEDREIDIVVDVGANAGQFGAHLRSLGYRGRIVSFEPTRSAFQALKARAAADPNWQVHHCGLGAAAGEALIQVSELSVLSSLLPLTASAPLHDSRVRTDHSEQISIRTLDEAAAGFSGNLLLKIDTQGYERQVLEGGPETAARTRGILLELPVIHVYEGQWQFQEAIEFMSNAGFVLAQVEPAGYHGADNVSVVDLDCLFRPWSPIDERRSTNADQYENSPPQQPR